MFRSCQPDLCPSGPGWAGPHCPLNLLHHKVLRQKRPGPHHAPGSEAGPVGRKPLCLGTPSARRLDPGWTRGLLRGGEAVALLSSPHEDPEPASGEQPTAPAFPPARRQHFVPIFHTFMFMRRDTGFPFVTIIEFLKISSFIKHVIILKEKRGSHDPRWQVCLLWVRTGGSRGLCSLPPPGGCACGRGALTRAVQLPLGWAQRSASRAPPWTPGSEPGAAPAGGLGVLDTWTVTGAGRCGGPCRLGDLALPASSLRAHSCPPVGGGQGSPCLVALPFLFLPFSSKAGGA